MGPMNITLASAAIAAALLGAGHAAFARDADCGADLICLAEASEAVAIPLCQKALMEAQPGAEFTHGLANPFFDWRGVGSLRDRTVAFSGNAARVSNAEGAQGLFYRCTFDPYAGTVSDIEVAKERLTF